jgi:hypothetical protein
METVRRGVGLAEETELLGCVYIDPPAGKEGWNHRTSVASTRSLLAGHGRQATRLRPTLVAERLGGWSWLPAVVNERPKQPVVHIFDAGQLIVA